MLFLYPPLPLSLPLSLTPSLHPPSLSLTLSLPPSPGQAYQYGVYTRELLEFGDKLSMLLLLPPSEDFGSSYWPLLGTKEPGLTLPLQVFELSR